MGDEKLASYYRETHFSVIRVNGVRSAQFSLCGCVFTKILKVKRNKKGVSV